VSSIINSLIESLEKKPVISDTAVDTQTLRQTISSLVTEANANVPSERRVTLRSALIVAERSLVASASLPNESRRFGALRDVINFISLTIEGSTGFNAPKHTDLLVTGHPESTAPTALTAAAFRRERARWEAAAPELDENIKPIVAAAFSAHPSSPEYLYNYTRLASAPAAQVPASVIASLEEFALTAAGDPLSGKNSHEARSARAKAQRRDSKGRFASMGGPIEALIRDLKGLVRKLVGRVVANTIGSDSFDVEVHGDPDIPDGSIVTIPAKDSTAIEAMLPTSAVKNAPRETVESLSGKEPIVNLADLMKTIKDAPSGWTKDPNYKKQNPSDPDERFVSGDGYIVDRFDKPTAANEPTIFAGQEVAGGKTNVGHDGSEKLDPTQPVYKLSRSTDSYGAAGGQELVGVTQSWADTQVLAEKDTPAFEKAAQGGVAYAKKPPVSAPAEPSATPEVPSAEDVAKSFGVNVKKIDAFVKDFFEKNPEQKATKKFAGNKNNPIEGLLDELAQGEDPQQISADIYALAYDLPASDDKTKLLKQVLTKLSQDVSDYNPKKVKPAKEAKKVEAELPAPTEEAPKAEAPAAPEAEAPKAAKAKAAPKISPLSPAQAQKLEAGDELYIFNKGIPKQYHVGSDGYIYPGSAPANIDADETQNNIGDTYALAEAMKNGQVSGVFKGEIPLNEDNKPMSSAEHLNALQEQNAAKKAAQEAKKAEKLVGQPEAKPAPEAVESEDKVLPEPFPGWKPGNKPIVDTFDEPTHGMFDGMADSKDYTDDPKKLASKFTEEQLSQALHDAINNGTGVGELPFEKGDEQVEADNLYHALHEQGADADKVLANAYDAGTGSTTNLDNLNKYREGLKNAPAEKKPELDKIDEITPQNTSDKEISRALMGTKPAKVAEQFIENEIKNGSDNAENYQAIKDAIKNIDRTGDTEEEGVQELAEKFAPWAMSKDPKKVQAFLGLMGLVAISDGGDGGGLKQFRAAIQNIITPGTGLVPGSGKQNTGTAADDFIQSLGFGDGTFSGYFPALLHSRLAVAQGKEDPNSGNSVAGETYKLMAFLSENVKRSSSYHRGIALDPDSPLLKTLTTEGEIIPMDGKPFSSDKSIAEDFAKIHLVDKRDSVILSVDSPIFGVDTTQWSTFIHEEEVLATGNYEVFHVAVEPKHSNGGKIYSVTLVPKDDLANAKGTGKATEAAPSLQENDADLNFKYGMNPAPYEPMEDTSGLPAGTSDKPEWIAKNFDTDALKGGLEDAIANADSSVRLKTGGDNGAELNVDPEAVRDALQIQGVDTNQLLENYSKAPAAPEAEAEGPQFDTDAEHMAKQDLHTPDDLSGYNQVSGALGSNEGGIYENADGDQIYVKKQQDALHGENEVLASALYQALGIQTANVRQGTLSDGTRVTYSALVPGAKHDLASKKNDPTYRKKLQQGFAADAWLANWDVVGTGYDNVVTDENGDPVRIDNGGAILFRAMGAPKGDSFGTEVKELDSLTKGSYSGKVFGDMTEADKSASAENLLKISDDQIDSIVNSAITNKATAAEVAKVLKDRRKNILDHYGIKDTASAEPEEPVVQGKDGKSYSKKEWGDSLVEWRTNDGQYAPSNISVSRSPDGKWHIRDTNVGADRNGTGESIGAYDSKDEAVQKAEDLVKNGSDQGNELEPKEEAPAAAGGVGGTYSKSTPTLQKLLAKKLNYNGEILTTDEFLQKYGHGKKTYEEPKYDDNGNLVGVKKVRYEVYTDDQHNSAVEVPKSVYDAYEPTSGVVDDTRGQIAKKIADDSLAKTKLDDTVTKAADPDAQPMSPQEAAQEWADKMGVKLPYTMGSWTLIQQGQRLYDNHTAATIDIVKGKNGSVSYVARHGGGMTPASTFENAQDAFDYVEKMNADPVDELEADADDMLDSQDGLDTITESPLGGAVKIASEVKMSQAGGYNQANYFDEATNNHYGHVRSVGNGTFDAYFDPGMGDDIKKANFGDAETAANWLGYQIADHLGLEKNPITGYALGEGPALPDKITVHKGKFLNEPSEAQLASAKGYMETKDIPQDRKDFLQAILEKPDLVAGEIGTLIGELKKYENLPEDQVPAKDNPADDMDNLSAVIKIDPEVGSGFIGANINDGGTSFFDADNKLIASITPSEHFAGKFVGQYTDPINGKQSFVFDSEEKAADYIGAGLTKTGQWKKNPYGEALSDNFAKGEEGAIPEGTNADLTPITAEDILNANLIMNEVQRLHPDHTVEANGDLKLAERTTDPDGNGNTFKYETMFRRTKRERFFTYVRETNLQTGEVRVVKIGKEQHSYKGVLKNVVLGRNNVLFHRDVRNWFQKKTGIETVKPGEGPSNPFTDLNLGDSIPKTGDAVKDSLISMIGNLAEVGEAHGPMLDALHSTAVAQGLSKDFVDQTLAKILENKQKMATAMHHPDGEPEPVAPHLSYNGKEIKPGDIVDWTDPETGTVHRGYVVKLQYKHNSKDYKYSDQTTCVFPTYNAEIAKQKLAEGKPAPHKNQQRNRVSSNLIVVDSKDAPMSEPFSPKLKEKLTQESVAKAGETKVAPEKIAETLENYKPAAKPVKAVSSGLKFVEGQSHDVVVDANGDKFVTFGDQKVPTYKDSPAMMQDLEPTSKSGTVGEFQPGDVLNMKSGIQHILQVHDDGSAIHLTTAVPDSSGNVEIKNITIQKDGFMDQAMLAGYATKSKLAFGSKPFKEATPVAAPNGEVALDGESGVSLEPAAQTGITAKDAVDGASAISTSIKNDADASAAVNTTDLDDAINKSAQDASTASTSDATTPVQVTVAKDVKTFGTAGEVTAKGLDKKSTATASQLGIPENIDGVAYSSLEHGLSVEQIWKSGFDNIKVKTGDNKYVIPGAIVTSEDGSSTGVITVTDKASGQVGVTWLQGDKAGKHEAGLASSSTKDTGVWMDPSTAADLGVAVDTDQINNGKQIIAQKIQQIKKDQAASIAAKAKEAQLKALADKAKVSGTGADTVVAEAKPWHTSEFAGVDSLDDALDKVKSSPAVSASGREVLVDSGNIEDNKVRVSTVNLKTGKKKVRVGFTLTSWTADGPNGLVSKLQQVGAKSTARMHISKWDKQADGSLVQNGTWASSYIDSSSTGTTYTVDVKNKAGQVIGVAKIHRANKDAGTPNFVDVKTTSSDKALAYHNKVELFLDDDVTSDDIGYAMSQVGVESSRPATKEDIRIASENKIVSMFGDKPDGTKNLTGEARQAALDLAAQSYGVRAEDMVPEQMANGDIHVMLPKEAGKLLAQKLNLKSFSHNWHSSMDADTLHSILTNGGIRATTHRWMHGINTSGASSVADGHNVGGNYVFHHANSGYGTFSFDAAEMCRRLDFYANPNDGWGKKQGGQLSILKNGAGEVMFKTSPALSALTNIDVGITVKKAVLKRLQSEGITMIDGKTVEEILGL
jgi:hypothetical protein